MVLGPGTHPIDRTRMTEMHAIHPPSQTQLPQLDHQLTAQGSPRMPQCFVLTAWHETAFAFGSPRHPSLPFVMQELLTRILNASSMSCQMLGPSPCTKH